jgi:hypothetical protein
MIETGRVRPRLSAARRVVVASDWLVRAGSRNEPRAKLHLALMFEQGRPGLAVDRARAQCFRQSANMEVNFKTCVRGWRRLGIWPWSK